MSDQIPFHIQEEIMARLPVTSLIRFRCVSKGWKSLIDSSQFIAVHTLRRHTQPQHLLVSCHDSHGDEMYVSYIDDETFPHQRSLPTLPPPLSTKQFFITHPVGSSCGLVCFSGCDGTSIIEKALLWNPSIRKSIIIDLPDEYDDVAFGVCPVTNDPKILSITKSSRDVPGTSYKWEVMIYTLSSGKWRSLSTNLPTIRIQYYSRPVVTDQFIYWYCRLELETHDMIMSFDVTRENFEVIDFQESLARRDRGVWDINKLRESLAILHYNRNNTCTVYTVWMMEHCVKRSFTNLFSIKLPPHNYVRGFWKNGIPIIQVTDGKYSDDGGYDKPVKLVGYEPTINHHNFLESSIFLDVNSYMETLLLLGRSDCISY